MHTISCQAADFQGYMAQGRLGAGCKDLDSGPGNGHAAPPAFPGPMWHACPSSAPAENAHPILLAWNLLPEAQAPPPPAWVACPEPTPLTPAGAGDHLQPTDHSCPRWATLWVGRAGLLDLVQTSAWLHTCCVTLNKLLPFSEQFFMVCKTRTSQGS